jgi:L-arabinokinase
LTVVFFISGHGFGHASRQVEIINAFGARVPEARILIRSAVSPALLARTLQVDYELCAGTCDTGIVQKTSVEHDDEGTIREAIDFYSTFDARAGADAERLAAMDVALVVGDIPPLAFDVAQRLAVPSVAIGNFTWDWIYETHPGMANAAPSLVPLIRRAYRAATHALELPFGGGFDVFASSRRIPLVARRPTRDRSVTRTHFAIPLDRPAVLLSFGGYGMPQLDLANVDAREWTLVLTDRILSMDAAHLPKNVAYLSEQRFDRTGFRYEDLVAAVDVVMSKPGYGIVSECIAGGTPLLYTSRGIFREYDVFVHEMPQFLRCQFISHSDLFAGRWQAPLETVLNRPAPSNELATNGADVAAAALALIARG